MFTRSRKIHNRTAVETKRVLKICDEAITPAPEHVATHVVNCHACFMPASCAQLRGRSLATQEGGTPIYVCCGRGTLGIIIIGRLRR
jgi:hypothetical protein